MNADRIDLILAKIRGGGRVLILSPSLDESRRELKAFAARTTPPETVRSSHGQESISHPSGGLAIFKSVRSNVRGISVDTVYLEAPATDEQLHELQLVVMSRGGAVLPGEPA